MSLTRGHAPGVCNGRRCDAVLLGGPSPRSGAVNVNGLDLSVVGRGRLSSLPLGPIDQRVVEGTLGQSQEGRYTRHVGGTLLLVNGVRGVAGARALDGVGRTYYWTREVESSGVHPWNAGRIVDGIRLARARLTALEDGARLQAPDAAIDAERGRARAAARRLALLVGQAAAALLAFAAYAATRRRRSVGEETECLRDSGARPWQLVVFQTFEPLLLAGAGVMAGWGAGTAGALVGAAVGRAPASEVLRGSVLSSQSVMLVVAAAVVAALVIGAFQRPQAAGVRRGRVLAVQSAVLVGVLALVWAAYSRGKLGAHELSASGGPGPILLVLPGLVGLLGAVAAIRTLPLVFRMLERWARRGPIPVRLALLSAARSPSETAMAVTFLALSLATGVFALGYRASLVRGEHDQAAYRTAADLAVTEAPRTLVAAPDVLPLARYARLPNVRVLPIMREQAQTLGGAGGPDATLDLVGVPAGALSTLPGWRTDFSPTPVAQLAARLDAAHGLMLSGAPLPPQTRSIGLRASVRGSSISLDVALQRRDGEFETVNLGSGLGPGPHDIERTVAPDLTGARVLAIFVGAPRGEDVSYLAGSLAVTPLRARTSTGRVVRVTAFRKGWVSDKMVQVGPVGPVGVKLSYAADAFVRTVALRQVQPEAREPVPAIVSPAVAREADPQGVLPLQRVGPGLQLRVVGVASYFPGMSGSRFAVVDTARLFRVLNTKSPGGALPSEAWLELQRGASRLAVLRGLRSNGFRSPQVRALVTERRALADDPLARSVVWALLIASVLGLVLGGIGLAVSLGAQIEDSGGELRELEAMGVTPAELRWHVRLTALLVAGLSVFFGLAGGVALAHLLPNLIAVDANGTDPVPPLIAVDPWGTLALTLGVVVVAIGAAVMVQTRAAFRGVAMGRLSG